ncbi:hypothetical protein H2200_009478 [Cladophialophora chaetospira]|uniref:Uncharacterized protein n=1 Tax=Cladophialophora chaetospira TaxID=386627 RepID=A0AA39CEV7_9EURO|nr:hypothetical protein H2200_009478 [Cladophialophora chaetospira]
MPSHETNLLEGVATLQGAIQKATTTAEGLADYDASAAYLRPIFGQINSRLQVLTLDLTRMQELESTTTAQGHKITSLESENEQLKQANAALMQRLAAGQYGSPPARQQRFTFSEFDHDQDVLSDDDSQMQMLPTQLPEHQRRPERDHDSPMPDAPLITPQTAAKRPRTTNPTGLETPGSPVERTKRVRTLTQKGAETQISQAPPRPRSTAPTQTTLAKQQAANDLFIMFQFEGDWSDALKTLFKAGLVSACSRTTYKEVLERIDKHCFGKSIEQPPDPRPCFLGEIRNYAKGNGGPEHTWQNCPFCAGRSTEVCCHAKFAPGVSLPYPERNAKGVVPRKTFRWQEPPEDDLTVATPDGTNIRWCVWLHRKGD